MIFAAGGNPSPVKKRGSVRAMSGSKRLPPSEKIPPIYRFNFMELATIKPSSTGFVRRHFSWGKQRLFMGNEVGEKYPGVGYSGTSVDLGGPTRVKFYDQTRYPNQGYSCFGCPHLVVDDKYFSPHCAHPFYLSLYPCPQYVATPKTFSAPPDCPMLGLKSERAQRRHRWHVKSHQIFWDYYHATKRNPYREGFTVYR